MHRADELRQILPRLLDPSPQPVLPSDTVMAAVLVPILVAAPQPRLVFTKRSDTLSRHAGEISFPGGLADPGESPAATALREAQEELGLKPSDVELVGSLPSVHTRVTGILIVPFVGLLARDPRYLPSESEIAGVLEFPLQDLIDAGAERDLQWEGRTFRTHVYDMDGQVIWGATAHILWSLVDLLRSTERAGPARVPAKEA